MGKKGKETARSMKLKRLMALGRTSTYFAEHSPPDIDWAIENVLESNGTMMLYGDSGIGKTFLSMHLAACVGSGARWFNHGCNKRKVLYLDAENGDGLMHRRANMIDPEGEADVTYYSFPDLSLDKDGRVLLALLVKETDAGLVILDPLMNHMQGDENSIEDVRPQIRGLRRMADDLDVALVLIHHENRSGGYRGSSGFKDLVTLQLRLMESDVKVKGFPHVLDVIPNKQRQSTLTRFKAVWRVANDDFTAGPLSTMKGGTVIRLARACEEIQVETGEWPGKTALVRAKDRHGLSQREAQRALDVALENNKIALHKGLHNKHEYRVPMFNIGDFQA